MNHINYVDLLKYFRDEPTLNKQIIKEGFDKNSLSPDEQQQLKEYIASLKEIKKSINELVSKSKKSQKPLGEAPKPPASDKIYAQDEDQIESLVQKIEEAGFILLQPGAKDKTADYAFIDPSTRDVYTSYQSGYVRRRYYQTTRWTGKDTHYPLNKRNKNSQPNEISSKLIPELEDRLRLILRHALKRNVDRRTK